jgi:lysophospholipase L1-like esterase
MSGTGLQLADMPGTARLTVTSNGSSFQEFDSRGTAVNDQTMTPLQVANTGGGYWGPVAVLALVTPNAGAVPPGAVLILGDSIAAGTGDAADALGLEGYIQRSLENNVPFISAARGSTTAAGLLAHGDGQYALSIDTGITDVILEPGRNDIEILLSGASALKSTITAVAARYAGAGRRAWCVTVVPSTYSNDGWMTAANQSFPAATSATGTAATASGAVQIALTSIANLTDGVDRGRDHAVFRRSHGERFGGGDAAPELQRASAHGLGLDGMFGADRYRRRGERPGEYRQVADGSGPGFDRRRASFRRAAPAGGECRHLGGGHVRRALIRRRADRRDGGFFLGGTDRG